MLKLVILVANNYPMIKFFRKIRKEILTENDASAYEMLSRSGELDLLTNKKILKGLQNMGILYNYINRLEKNQEQLMFLVLPKISEYIRMNPMKVMQPGALYNYKFHNDVEFFIKIGSERLGYINKRKPI